jgi:cysteinyl-tRNA synthetase
MIPYDEYPPMLHLYNTRTKSTDPFRPIKENTVGLYTCGPTVYHYAHIGNLRTYIFEDILKRTLHASGYTVRHVMNITDVGHLTDDADSGEDKMEKGARREGKNAWDVALFYTQAFEQDMAALNILPPNIWCKATDHIPEQIAMVQTLMDKGCAYETHDGIYFDTTTFPAYGEMANLKNQSLDVGARVDMGEKKNPHDFALWKWSPQGETRHMEWDAFGKKGFPGWHIECSAMARKYLGDHFDIHCGGIDHVPIHHTNEIAQTEAVTGISPWVNVWMHGEFLTIGDGAKMAKSGDNFITLQTLADAGYSPLDYRYLLLQAHYRKQLSFSMGALAGARTGLARLREAVAGLPDKTEAVHHIEQEFMDALADDLNTPSALAILSKAVKEKSINKKTAYDFDKVLGLNLHITPENTSVHIPEDVKKLLDMRAIARENKQWNESDALRAQIENKGFVVKDTPDGQRLTQNA